MLTKVARYRLQYASNFHISGKIQVPFTQYLNPVPKTDLALLGNIGQPNPELAKFFHWCQTKYPATFWVPGNLELCSSVDAKQDIHEKPELLRRWLKKQKLDRVYLMTKRRIDMHGPNITILGTNMIDPPLEVGGKKLYRLQNGLLEPMSADTIAAIQKDESEWLIRNVRQSPNQCVCLLGNEIRFAPNRWYNYSSVSAQLFGAVPGLKPQTFTGRSSAREPWVGVNMYGHSGYNPSAFIEIVDIVSEAEEMEARIYDSLCNSTPPELRPLKPMR